jgi:glycolate oxidase iron-sulfur subunit
MKEALEGSVELQGALPYIDRCLGCLACVTACPSGVQYGELVTSFRAHSEQRRRRSLPDRILRGLILRTLPYPRRLRWAAVIGRWTLPFQGLLPRRLRDMMMLLPDRLPDPKRLPEIYPAEGKRLARVALLAGCAQQVLDPDINWATLRVLARNGVETFIPRDQSCCGALAAHTGAMWQAQSFARRNIRSFPTDVDAVVTNAAGCGSGMHEYGLWLRGTPDEEEAQRFSSQVCDVSVFLDRLGFKAPHSLRQPTRVAYHDACHLAHAQKVRLQPRRLLMSVPGLQLVEIPNGDMCCGSAGTYNIEQPDVASKLGIDKAASIAGVEPDIVVSGNIGCLTQIQAHLRRQNALIPVMHTMQLLDRAYRDQVRAH